SPQANVGAVNAKIGEAETLIRMKKFVEAVPLLKPFASTNLIARRLLLECYSVLDRTKELAEEFYPPVADNEIIYVADALWTENKQKLLRLMLESDVVRASSNPAVAEVVNKYSERLK